MTQNNEREAFESLFPKPKVFSTFNEQQKLMGQWLDCKRGWETAIAYVNKQNEQQSKQIPDGWKLIETAPKDGSSFDVWLGNCDESERRFYCSGNTRRSPDWHYKDGKYRPNIALGSIPTFITPTHWMPLPSAPTNTEVGE